MLRAVLNLLLQMSLAPIEVEIRQPRRRLAAPAAVALLKRKAGNRCTEMLEADASKNLVFRQGFNAADGLN